MFGTITALAGTFAIIFLTGWILLGFFADYLADKGRPETICLIVCISIIYVSTMLRIVKPIYHWLLG